MPAAGDMQIQRVVPGVAGIHRLAFVHRGLHGRTCSQAVSVEFRLQKHHCRRTIEKMVEEKEVFGMDVWLESNVFPGVASVDCRPELAAPALVGNAFRAIYETFLRRLIVWEGGIYSSNEAESEDGCAWMACRCVAAAFENIIPNAIRELQ